MFVLSILIGFVLIALADIVDGDSLGFDTSAGLGVFWSPRVIGAFLIGFGATALIGQVYFDLDTRLATLAGLMSGFILGFAIRVAFVILKNEESNSLSKGD